MLSNKLLLTFLLLPLPLLSAEGRREMVSINAVYRDQYPGKKGSVEVPSNATTKELVGALNSHFDIDLDDGCYSYYYQGKTSKIVHCPHPSYKDPRDGFYLRCNHLREVSGKQWVNCTHRHSEIIKKASFDGRRILIIKHREDEHTADECVLS